MMTSVTLTRLFVGWGSRESGDEAGPGRAEVDSDTPTRLALQELI